MTNYIELDPEGNILQSGNFKFSENTVETEEEIVRGHDGVLYLQSKLPPVPLEILKNDRLVELKQKRDEYKIAWGYSDNTYNNLKDGLTNNPELLEKYKDFLRDLIEKYDSFKTAIENASDVEELEQIEIKF
jgi:molecular chaperone GrpE (heat shock protein)